jgi:hypothetical protein
MWKKINFIHIKWYLSFYIMMEMQKYECDKNDINVSNNNITLHIC